MRLQLRSSLPLAVTGSAAALRVFLSLPQQAARQLGGWAISITTPRSGVSLTSMHPIRASAEQQVIMLRRDGDCQGSSPE
jgi:hypothetical protein